MKNYFGLSQEQQEQLAQSFANEPDAFFAKAEDDQLKEALSRSYTERFYTMTRLMKMNQMLSKAKITINNNQPK